MKSKNMLKTLLMLGGGILVFGSIFFLLTNINNKKQTVEPVAIPENVSTTLPIEQTTNSDIQIEKVDEEENIIALEEYYKEVYFLNDTKFTINKVKNEDVNNLTTSNTVELKGKKFYQNNLDEVIFVANNKDKTIIQFYNIETQKITTKTINIPYKNILSVAKDDENMYIATISTNNSSILNIVSLTKENEVKKVKLSNYIPQYMTVYNNNVFYTLNNKLFKLDLKTNKTTQLNLGEKTENMYHKDNIIYVYNKFGEGNNNSLLFKINLDTFKVEDVYETKDKKCYVKGIDLLKNTIYFETYDTTLDKVLEDVRLQKRYSVQEVDLETLDVINIYDTVSEYEDLKTTKENLFASDLFILN